MEIPADVLAAKSAISARLLLPVLATTPSNAAAQPALAALRAHGNVHAVGIGNKRVQGHDTPVAAVRIYVRRKLPKACVAIEERIPPWIDGIPLDVIQSAPASLMGIPTCSENRQSRVRPVVGGVSAGHAGAGAGTIACVCHSTMDTDPPGMRLLLGNQHVFTGPNGEPGEAIFQPGPLDGAAEHDQVAELHRSVPVITDGTTPNQVDAAVCRMLHDTECSATVCTIGQITGTSPAHLGMIVRKHGRTSGYTEGIVADLSYDAIVGANPYDSAVVALFEEQLLIESIDPAIAFALPGDSGSLIVRRDAAEAVGLYFAGPMGGAYGVASRIELVETALNISLV